MPDMDVYRSVFVAVKEEPVAIPFEDLRHAFRLQKPRRKYERFFERVSQALASKPR
jgi:hypothetical protein